jgi:hypothetical protein
MAGQRTVLENGPGSLSEYYDWMNSAKNGDILVYWHGCLQYDRQVMIPFDDVMRSADRLRIASLNAVASRVFDDAEDGLLSLTQHRLGEGISEYRATRRRQSFGGTSDVSGPRNDNIVLA